MLNKKIKSLTLTVAATLLLGTAMPANAGVDQKNVMFILDASNSMWGQIDGKPKIEIAKSVLMNLAAKMPADVKMGLIAYGHRFDRKLKECGDMELMNPIGQFSAAQATNSYRFITPKGQTPIADTLNATAGWLEEQKGQNNTVVLISDGLESCGGDVCAAAKALNDAGVTTKIHVVGFDLSKEKRAKLQCIAANGNGKMFAANDAKSLSAALIQVRKDVAKPVEAPPVVVVQAPPIVPPAPPLPPKPVVYFEDNFNGEELGEHWGVAKPNPDAFIIEDGKLLIISGTPGSMANETVENVFKLSTPLPKGDWTITAKISIEFQTWYERAFIGIFKDRDNYLEISLQSIVGEYGLNRYPAFDIVGVRRRKGNDKTVNQRLWRGPNTGDYSNVGNFADGTKAFPQPVLLRLKKQGRSYIGGVMLEGAKEPKWLNLDKFTSLRQKGKVAVGLYQTNKVKGESMIQVDWVKIETLK